MIREMDKDNWEAKWAGRSGKDHIDRNGESSGEDCAQGRVLGAPVEGSCWVARAD